MRVKNATLVFDDVAKVGAGDATINYTLKGKISDVVRYVSKEPINLGDEIGMDPNSVKGNADLKVKLVFPAQNNIDVEDFKITILGTLTDAYFPNVIDTLDLSGGPLDFSVKENKVVLKGNAMLEKRPMNFEWRSFLYSKGKPYKEKLKAQLTVDPNLRAQVGIDLSDFLEGSVKADIDYVGYNNGKAVAKIKVDATPAVFFVEPFDYVKPSGEQGDASFTAHFKGDTIKEITDLKAKGKEFTLAASTIKFSEHKGETWIHRGDFPSFTLQKTRGGVSFVFDKSRAVDITMNAEFMDAQPFMDAEEIPDVYEEPPMRITTTAKEMLTAPGKVINDVKSFMDIDGEGRFNKIELDARVGKSDVVVRFQEDKLGQRKFSMNTEDAGALLNAFDVYEGMRGGKMTISGEPIKGVRDRNIKGKAEIRNFKIVDAPAATKVLSVLSLTGIGDALSNKGLKFSKLETDFKWIYRRKGSLLKLKKGRTSGNSIGVVFDGTFDNEKREVDMDGTLIPMSGLNKVLRKIPLVGDILTGGSGGIFAATFSVKGSSEDPVISANPLSVITPGILRRVLWE